MTSRDLEKINIDTIKQLWYYRPIWGWTKFEQYRNMKRNLEELDFGKRRNPEIAIAIEFNQ